MKGKSVIKNLICIVMAGILLFSGSAYAAEAFAFKAPAQNYDDFMEYQGIKVFVNGRYVEFNNDLGYPVAINNRIYIPVRAVSETFNAFVSWIGERSEVHVSKYGSQIRIKIGESQIEKINNLNNTVDRETISMDAKAFAENGRTYVTYNMSVGVSQP